MNEICYSNPAILPLSPEHLPGIKRPARLGLSWRIPSGLRLSRQIQMPKAINKIESYYTRTSTSIRPGSVGRDFLPRSISGTGPASEEGEQNRWLRRIH